MEAILNRIYTLLLNLLGGKVELNVGVELDSTTSSVTIEQMDSSNLNVRSIPLDDEAGVSKTITYYSGVEAGNPSGTTTNVKTIVYTLDGNTILTKTFTYNTVDGPLTVINS